MFPLTFVSPQMVPSITLLMPEPMPRSAVRSPAAISPPLAAEASVKGNATDPVFPSWGNVTLSRSTGKSIASSIEAR